MHDQEFKFEVTADRLDAALPTFTEALCRQRHNSMRSPVFILILMSVSAVIVMLVVAKFVPELPPKGRYAVVAAAMIVQLLIWVAASRRMSVFRGLTRWSAGIAIGRTKKRAPFTARYRVSDREYEVAIDKLGLRKQVNGENVRMAYRSPELILFFRRPSSSNPRSVVYLADDEHRRAMDRFIESNQILVHELPNDSGIGPTASDPGGKPAGGTSAGRSSPLRRRAIAAAVLALTAAMLYLFWGAAFDASVQRNLEKYRQSVERSDLDPPSRTELVGDFNLLRSSIDKRNNFSLSQWIDIDLVFKNQLVDAAIDEHELANLRVEIRRLKKIQGIDAN
jgi:hypothetical protein